MLLPYHDESGSTTCRPGQGNADIFVARLDASGTFKAVSTGGGAGSDCALACALGASGQLHVVGDGRERAGMTTGDDGTAEGQDVLARAT